MSNLASEQKARRIQIHKELTEEFTKLGKSTLSWEFLNEYMHRLGPCPEELRGVEIEPGVYLVDKYED